MDALNLIQSTLELDAEAAQALLDKWRGNEKELKLKLDGLALVNEEKGWAKAESRCKLYAQAHKAKRPLSLSEKKRKQYARSSMAIFARADANGQPIPFPGLFTWA